MILCDYRLHKISSSRFYNQEGEKYLGKLGDDTELSCVFKGVEHFNYILMLELPQYLKHTKKLVKSNGIKIVTIY